MLFGSMEILDIQNTVTRRVPRREADFKLDASEAQDLSLVKIDRRLGAGDGFQTEEGATTTCPPQHVIVRM